VIGPAQRPHPPIWYGAQSLESVVWAARNGISIGSHLPDAVTRRNSDRYRAEWAALGRDPGTLPYIAASRHIVLAETDREALELARRAYRVWQTNFYYLNRRTGYPRKINYPETPARPRRCSTGSTRASRPGGSTTCSAASRSAIRRSRSACARSSCSRAT
jgi:alkanesulfonate monooxygenase SsuD/methylene tetrahydromethanopterin reductase-like flavin-dependent oxidoreductase (luciferase family)